MTDTSTIASLATAGGTLALALATFSSTRSANRAARVSEQALKVGLRNVGPGLAVLHGWHLWRERRSLQDPPSPEELRRLSRDLYVPAGDVGFWQGALRDPDDPLYPSVQESIRSRRPMSLDLLYGDHEGGQHTITRFNLIPRGDVEQEPWLWGCAASRDWNLDRAEPR